MFQDMGLLLSYISRRQRQLWLLLELMIVSSFSEMVRLDAILPFFRSAEQSRRDIGKPSMAANIYFLGNRDSAEVNDVVGFRVYRECDRC